MNENVQEMPVSLTESAIREIKRIMQDEDKIGKQLRIGVKGGGCSGLSYILEFEEKSANDELFVFEGIPCIMNPAHAIYLSGMQIDWEGGLNSRGFTFTNPNASKTCGCGTSFGV